MRFIFTNNFKKGFKELPSFFLNNTNTNWLLTVVSKIIVTRKQKTCYNLFKVGPEKFDSKY